MPLLLHFRLVRALLARAALLAIAGTATVNAQDFTLPAAPRLVDVTKINALYNEARVKQSDYPPPPPDANGADYIDDTAAFQWAFRYAVDRVETTGYPPIIYVPKGTYLISGSLRATDYKRSGGLVYDADGKPVENTWKAGLYLIGENREETILRVPPSAAVFGNAAAPVGVIVTGTQGAAATAAGGGNEAFRHSIRNLTIDVGDNNPGALAIDYCVSNWGNISNVSLRNRASRPATAARTGLSMRRNIPGPGLVRDVQIEGFNYGIELEGGNDASMTFENIHLSGQHTFGVSLGSNPAFIRRLVSHNTVTAIRLNGQLGHLSLLDSELLGGAPGNPAILTLSAVSIHRLRTSGYGVVVDNGVRSLGPGERYSNPVSGLTPDLVANAAGVTFTNQYLSRASINLRDSAPQTSLNLPVEDAPSFHTNDPARHVLVTDSTKLTTVATPSGFSRETSGSTSTDDGNNDAIGIQAAIDRANTDIVYLPTGRYTVSQSIRIRGGVRKIVGLNAQIVRATSATSVPTFIIEDGPASDPDRPIILEGLRGGPVLIDTSRPVVFRHNLLGGTFLTSTARSAGKIFIEDCIAAGGVFNPGQRVWARQWNAEGYGTPQITANGATIWILGIKTEEPETVLSARDGARVEMLGAYALAAQTDTRLGLASVPATTPLLSLQNAAFTGSFATNLLYPYERLVADTQGDSTLFLEKPGATGSPAYYRHPASGSAWPNIPLYASYPPGWMPAAYWPLNTNAAGQPGPALTLGAGASFSTEAPAGATGSVRLNPAAGVAAATPSNDASFSFTDRLTVSLWVRPATAAATLQTLVHNASAYSLTLEGASRRVVASVRGPDGWIRADSGVDLAAEAWSHVALRWSSASAQLAVFVNGAKRAEVAAPQLVAGADPLVLGGRSAVTNTDAFDGWLDEVRVFNRALADSELTEQWAGRPAERPVAPRQLTLSPIAGTSSGAALTWTDASDNETGYVVERSGLGAWSPIAELSADSTSYSDSGAGLNPGVAHRYRVFARNAAGDGPCSNIVTGPTNAVPVALIDSTPLALSVVSGAGQRFVDIPVRNVGGALLSWSGSLPSRYSLRSSAQGGPAYAWIDLAATGSGATIATFPNVSNSSARDDTLTSAINLGMTFPFMGRTYTQVRVCSNGFVSLGGAGTKTSYQPANLPSTNLDANTLAVFWDDLYLVGNRGNVYYKLVENEGFVISWERAGFYANQNAENSFQVILRPNGVITMQYKRLDGGSANGSLIGVQGVLPDANKVETIQHAFIKTYSPPFALTYAPPSRGEGSINHSPGASASWATLSAASGTLAAGAAGQITLVLDPANLNPTNFETTLTLTTNDLQVPGLSIPVRLAVFSRETLASWRLSRFRTPFLTASSAGEADPDGDGRLNLLEYALGSDPLAGDSGTPVTSGINVSTNRLTLEFDRRRDATDINYVVWASGDLATWEAIWTSETVPYGGGTAVSQRVTVEDTLPLSSQTRRFLRLEIQPR